MDKTVKRKRKNLKSKNRKASDQPPITAIARAIPERGVLRSLQPIFVDKDGRRRYRANQSASNGPFERDPMHVNTHSSGKSQVNPPVIPAKPLLRRPRALMIGVITVLAITMAAQKQKDDASPNVDAAVRAVLDAQVAAWNHHDLEGFMAGYWNSPELTFFSGATETKGWQPTLERYRRSYQAEGKAMGTLSFSDLQIQALAPDAAFVRGKFQLVMPDGKQPHGVFTLIFRKFPDGWRIIHDHTCSG